MGENDMSDLSDSLFGEAADGGEAKKKREGEWPHMQLSSAQDFIGSDSGGDRVGLSGGSSGGGFEGLGEGRKGRLRFGADELAVVMSHYDVGIIRAIQEFPRGSRKAPKALIRTDSGLYLLKRRAHGKDDPFKVAFCHALQLHLTEKQFPLPHLIGTRDENNSMLQLGGRVYELFEYIKGSSYDGELETTSEGGKILGLYHRLTKDFKSEYEPAKGTYHDSVMVKKTFELIPQAINKVKGDHGIGRMKELEELSDGLEEDYLSAGLKGKLLGMDDWPTQVVHSDWHPGNLLYRRGRVVAVIDYDAARIQQRVMDVANGALQFSILGGGDHPERWPAYLDESRLKRFVRGYEGVRDCVLSKAEVEVMPWLMIEALIAESAIPVAATGQFANMDGAAFLEMVGRKVDWLKENAERLVGLLVE
ncbi:homoserine kinase [Poriferisphaera corsica]|uniref:Homoserine kinase n=1 Tax=Poriferisphaera corsica TaxID=2528020 RepID=A0A517YY73_9BACT|nr:phosphotransferase [Poriferisphaera corsica]QDU35181.1 homoserine kinase [Poriferisphaera corsica]